VTQDSLAEISRRFGETRCRKLSSLTKKHDSSESLYISASVQAITSNITETVKSYGYQNFQKNIVCSSSSGTFVFLSVALNIAT
jgi:L-asparaginase II